MSFASACFPFPSSLCAADHFDVVALGVNAGLFHGVTVHDGGDADGDQNEREHDADTHPKHGERPLAEPHEVGDDASLDLEAQPNPRHRTQNTGRAPGVTSPRNQGNDKQTPQDYTKTKNNAKNIVKKAVM